jgi:hypothetical protein
MRRTRAIIISLSLFAAMAAGSFGTSAALAQSAASTNDAGAPATLKMEVPIPVSPLEQGVTNAGVGVVSDISQYIGRIYNFAIGVVGLIAAVMMIIGGFQYLTSAGDAGKIGAAKKRITDAIIGLVLMLGSYALLNTINPALLAFKPLSSAIDKNAIKTQINFIPWCDDLVDPADPTKRPEVLPLADTADCGTIGTYKVGNGTSYCLFRGQCGESPVGPPRNGGTNYWETCLQQGGLTKGDIDSLLAGTSKKPALKGTGKNSTVAACVPCFAITAKVATAMGYYGLASACDAWGQSRTQQFNSRYTPLAGGQTGYPADELNRFWSYCSAAVNKPTCVQADVDCFAANRNSNPFTPSTGGVVSYIGSHFTAIGQVANLFKSNCESTHSCACEGYNDSPQPIWSSEDHTLDDALKGTYSTDSPTQKTLDFFPYHLSEMCLWNPCQNYVDPESKLKSFEKGCKGNDGSISTAIRFIGHQDAKMSSCGNQ